MNIREAVIEAKPNEYGIYREAWGDIICIYPTDTVDCCIIVSKRFRPGPRWNPSQEDLLADDWNVKRVSMSEVLSVFGISVPIRQAYLESVEPVPVKPKRRWGRSHRT